MRSKRSVSGVDYLVLLHGWAIQTSTTTALQTRHLSAEEFEAIARSVTALRPTDGPEETPKAEGTSSGSADAAVDEIATRTRGEELEDYSFYRAAGSWIGEGTWMTGAAIASMGSWRTRSWDASVWKPRIQCSTNCANSVSWRVADSARSAA